MSERKHGRYQNMAPAINIYMQFGCGFSAPPGWLNFDASPTLRLQRLPLLGVILKKRYPPVFPINAKYGDIVRGLPIVPESCKGIYCSHVLEHLALQDFRQALENTNSYLMVGGVFRLVVPDLEHLAKVYLESDEPTSSLEFMRRSHLGRENRPKKFIPILRQLFGNSSHLWMWDYDSLQLELSNAGFRKIRRAFFGDSEDERFSEVEEFHRWEDNLGIQCSK